jgi:5S rRNA maturation endonuclease (ribonuclease M5)
MVTSILETDLAELLDLFSVKLAVYLIFLGVLPSIWIYKLQLRKSAASSMLWSKVKTILVLIMIFTLVTLLFSKTYTSFNRENKQLRLHINPSYFMYAIGKYASNQFKSISTSFIIIGQDATIQRRDNVKKLVIVESPAKSKTIKKYLGKDVEVLASYGHVRDLLPKEGAVDTENDFAMKYQIIDRNSKHVDAIAKAMRKADELYLATDPDREGEAISWHLYELLKKRGILKNKETHRVVFHEITKQAVNDAVANPRELSMDMVNAQQARRAGGARVQRRRRPLGERGEPTACQSPWRRPR